MSDYKTYLIEKRKQNVAKIKEQVSIVDVAKEFFDLKKHGSYLKLVGHESCVLYEATNTFYRYAYGVYGDVFDFLKEFEECGHMDFNAAYNYLLPKIDPTKELQKTSKQIRKEEDAFKKMKRCAKTLHNQLNKYKAEDNRNAMAYLIQERGIAPDIVYSMIEKGYIKQINHDFGKSVVFLSYNPIGVLSNICYRSCNSNSKAKGDFEGCDYNYGWFYTPNYDEHLHVSLIDQEKALVCFESYIDMLSYMTILMQEGKSIKDYNYLSCGSVTKKDLVLKYQEQYHFEKVILAFDKDDAGITAMTELKEKLQDKGIDVKIHISQKEGKDWNEILKNDHKAKSLENRVLKAKITYGKKQKNVNKIEDKER